MTNTENAKKYTTAKIRLSVINMILNLILLVILAFSPLAVIIEKNIMQFNINIYLSFLIFAGICSLAIGLINLPLDFYNGYILEHKYSLSNQSFFAWLKEGLKGLSLSLIIGIPLLLLFFLLIKNVPNLWWLIFAAIIFIFSALLAQLAPVLIFPLFYKFKEITEGEVYSELTKILEQQKISFRGIYSFNMSKDTKKANAAFTGFGKTRRIILADTLLNEFNPAEIKTIFAHELGHLKFKHIIKNIAFSGTVTFLSLFICNLIYNKISMAMGYSSQYQFAPLSILVLCLSLFGLLLMPLTNIISRYYEVQADRYALVTTGDKASFISAMEKLAGMNLSDKEPNPIAEFLLYSHPSIKKRIKLADSFNKIG